MENLPTMLGWRRIPASGRTSRGFQIYWLTNFAGHAAQINQHLRALALDVIRRQDYREPRALIAVRWDHRSELEAVLRMIEEAKVAEANYDGDGGTSDADRREVTITLPVLRFLNRRRPYIALHQEKRLCLEHFLVCMLKRFREPEWAEDPGVNRLDVRILVPRQRETGVSSQAVAGIVHGNWPWPDPQSIIGLCWKTKLGYPHIHPRVRPSIPRNTSERRHTRFQRVLEQAENQLTYMNIPFGTPEMNELVSYRASMPEQHLFQL